MPPPYDVVVVDVVDVVDVVEVVEAVPVVDVVEMVDVVDVVDVVPVVEVVEMVDVVEAVDVVDDPAVVPVPVAAPLVDVVALGAVDEAISAAGLTVTALSGSTKITVSEPVFASCWTCTSATNAGGSPHGSLPAGSAVPASWVTYPRNRYVSPPVAEMDGFPTSEPTNWTLAPVAPVMSTARMEPPSARQVPTLTWTGDLEPVEVGVTSAVPEKAGESDVFCRPSVPVLRIEVSRSDERGGTAAGALTPGNPVTAVHAPAGSERAGVVAAVEEAVGEVVVPVGVVPAVPGPCSTVIVPVGTDDDVVLEVGVEAVEVAAAGVEVAAAGVEGGVEAVVGDVDGAEAVAEVPDAARSVEPFEPVTGAVEAGLLDDGMTR